LAEIFIIQCDFTGKMTQPSSVTKFSSLQPTLEKHDNVSNKKSARHKSLKWIGMDCAGQKYTNDVQFVFEKNFLKKFFLLPESRHFARENTISENEVLLFFSRFW